MNCSAFDHTSVADRGKGASYLLALQLRSLSEIPHRPLPLCLCFRSINILSDHNSSLAYCLTRPDSSPLCPGFEVLASVHPRKLSFFVVNPRETFLWL